MKRYIAILAVASGCPSTDGNNNGADPTAAGTGVGVDDGGPGTAGEGGSGAGSNADNGGSTGNADSATDGGDDAPPETKFDLGDGNGFCKYKDAGMYCDGSTSVLCDGSGSVEDSLQCVPDVCVEGEGCVKCLDGQHACVGPRVMACDTTGPTATWQEVEICDPAAQQVCDSSVGTCVPLAPIGGTEPTGEYYAYAIHDLTGTGFSGISDVDSFGDRIYFVANYTSGLSIGSFDVELIDSDGDGKLEPNQHPDYPDEQGPIEERVFTFVESFNVDNPGAFPNIMETYATATTISYSGPNNVSQRVLATGVTTQIAPIPTWLSATGYTWLAFLGYDEVNDVWYSGNEAARRVFQYDNESGTWGYAFEFPVLAGDHMDGMEVVVDPSTGTPFVYVSDMTSNFIGQYRHDADQGWVQENLFSYVETTGALVEGFGYGALNHFWVGSLGMTFYELGGGDLTEFLDPAG